MKSIAFDQTFNHRLLTQNQVALLHEIATDSNLMSLFTRVNASSIYQVVIVFELNTLSYKYGSFKSLNASSTYCTHY